MTGETTGDLLGGVFARLRGAIDDRDGDEPSGATTVEPEPVEPEPVEPERVQPTGAPAGAEEFAPAVAVDPFDLEPAEPEPGWPVFGVAESATLDDAGLRRRRDAAVRPAVAALAPRVKRHLQDEQNQLLDTLRRQKAKIDPARALPAEAEQFASWADVLAPAVDELYAAGRVLGGGRTRPAPSHLARGLAELMVAPLRERVLTTIDAVVREGPYDGLAELQRAMVSAVGARYREWRSQDLEPTLGDLLTAAFARGVYDATPEGARLRWVPAEVEQCPDADDNALEPTAKGRAFPTGQSCPPAHPGCRCLVVPADG